MQSKEEGIRIMSDLVVEKRGTILSLTLNRPDRLNAFSEEMIAKLTAEIKQAQSDESIKVVILNGAGRSFSAGGDVKTMGQASGVDVYEHIGRLNECILAMQNLEKPIISAVHGFAAGAAFNLALASDFIIASEESRFVLSFSQVGLISDGGGLYFLTKVVGPHRAKELLFLGEPMDADTAYKAGFLNRVVPLNQLKDEVTSFASRLSQGPTKAYGKMKKIVNDSFHLTLEQVLEQERLTQVLMVETRDHQEGISAFKEKRKPLFQGK
ncbi:enoyl-CoA hydratase [Priestia megaterium]|uniref:Enoyl-CoA hydratase n=2 Tax=Priestia megaterium TaxID=1404 RepID=A0AA86M2V2_PRIMG|nr:enoyl-CoA hydratase [Priestia megaterium]